MSIIDPEVIQKGEKGLLSSILSSLDMYQIEKLFNKSYNLSLKEKLELKKGDIVVYNNQITYKLSFSAVATFSLLMDKMGNYQGFTKPDDVFLSNAERTDLENSITDFELLRVKEAEFLDSLAATINTRRIIEFFQKVFKLKTNGIVIYKHGDIIVFNGRVAYKLIFDIEVNFSLYLDRRGKHIGLAISEDDQRIAKEVNG
jgi:hypothetical protein